MHHFHNSLQLSNPIYTTHDIMFIVTAKVKLI